MFEGLLNPPVIALATGLGVTLLAIKVIDPTERGVIEQLGRYHRFAGPGMQVVIPLFERLRRVNVTEQMVNAKPQDIITKDNLNARVDAQIYFKVKGDEESVKKSQYNVNDYYEQITALAQTTLRDIIGDLVFTAVNSKRGELNEKLGEELGTETNAWGIQVVRTELKEIEPPEDVQETMNKVLKAQNEKTAAVDYAMATETQADGKKRASIKEAEGIKQARILEAEGQAKAIELVNTAASKYFRGCAVHLKKLEVAESALKDNTKYVVPEGSSLMNVIGDLAGTKFVPVQEPSTKVEYRDRVVEKQAPLDIKTMSDEELEKLQEDIEGELDER